MQSIFRVVPDTNILIAAEKSRNEGSPNKEFFARWQNYEFDLLYSDDILLEYIEKLRFLGVPEITIKKFIRALLALGIFVEIAFFHLPRYPVDADDIAFLLCADNGDATHLITYDPHLKVLNSLYGFQICETLDFLTTLRLVYRQ